MPELFLRQESLSILGVSISTLSRNELLARAEAFLVEAKFHRIASV